MEVKKIYLKLSFLCIIVFNCLSINAQFRTYSNEFMNIGAGARGLSMGAAQVASSLDATAGYYNPAGLAYVRSVNTFSIMHADYFSGIGKYDYISAALPLNDEKRTLGLTALRFAVEDIPNTLFLVDPQTGQLNYNNIKSFSSADYGVLLSYGQFLKDMDGVKVSVGGNAKVLYRKVGSFANAWGFGLDGSVMIDGQSWKIGLMAKDLSTTYNAWKFNFTEREKEILYLTQNKVPIKSTEITQPRLIVGGAYNLHINSSLDLLAEGNIDVTFDGKRNTLLNSKVVSIDPRIGLEANIQNKVFLRMGATNFQRGLSDADTLNQKKTWIFQPSIGAGFRVGKFVVDYAFSNLANQSNPLYTHVFSIRFDLDKVNKK